MIPRCWVILPSVVAVFLLLSPVEAQGQPTDGWWVSVTIETGSDRPVDQRRNRRGNRSRSRGLHIPKGHLPPPGQCRLWYPGRPPGQQPPPTSCRRAYRGQSGSALVVTPSGKTRGRTPRRWYRSPTEDIVFRRRPSREEGVRIDAEVIIDLLGERGYRQLQAQQKRLGVSGSLSGRWVSTGPSGGHVLQVRAGDHPLAELADHNRDLRVERLFFPED